MSKDHEASATVIRLDKWLWAARLFKTRALAKQAVETGKVQGAGNKLKPGRDVGIGLELEVRQGWDTRTIVVKALSEHRRGAPEAALLYEETPQSVEKRAQLAEQRRLHAQLEQPIAKPDKKDRRLRSQMKHYTE
tara:strand:+ start:379 stop:783 length:405 start_codon:yes stop_codon:yes gene_type:complete